jgi:hypothetical protein
MKSGGEVVEEAALTEDGREGRLPRSMITPIAGLRSMSQEPSHQLGSRCIDVSSGDWLDPVTPSHAHHSGRLTLGHIWSARGPDGPVVLRRAKRSRKRAPLWGCGIPSNGVRRVP